MSEIFEFPSKYIFVCISVTTLHPFPQFAKLRPPSLFFDLAFFFSATLLGLADFALSLDGRILPRSQKSYLFTTYSVTVFDNSIH